ncbi:hypothetical protein IAU59_000267 [Kwoniella sp. CBS 9459]
MGRSASRKGRPEIIGRIRLIRHTIALLALISIADLLLLVALVIKPFSEAKSWALACWTGERFWTYMQKHWELNLNAKPAVEVTGDEIPKGESAFVLCNHLGYSDYYLIQYLSSRAGMLGQSRYFVKKEILRIPFFGLAFWAFGMILISRNWTSDQRLLEQTFSRIKANAHKSWIILYPEGTRRTPKKLLQSQAFARENDKPELDHVLFPRTKGFASTVQALRKSHVKHIYDLTFLYSSPEGWKDQHAIPTLAEMLSCDDLHKRGYGFRIHVRRIPIDTLPLDEKGLKAWCEDAWVKKDRLLDEMIKRETLHS